MYFLFSEAKTKSNAPTRRLATKEKVLLGRISRILRLGAPAWRASLRGLQGKACSQAFWCFLFPLTFFSCNFKFRNWKLPRVLREGRWRLRVTLAASFLSNENLRKFFLQVWRSARAPTQPLLYDISKNPLILNRL